MNSTLVELVKLRILQMLFVMKCRLSKKLIGINEGLKSSDRGNILE